jgi:hypothetical protein
LDQPRRGGIRPRDYTETWQQVAPTTNSRRTRARQRSKIIARISVICGRQITETRAMIKVAPADLDTDAKTVVDPT